jgi:hypothetical protein
VPERPDVEGFGRQHHQHRHGDRHHEREGGDAESRDEHPEDLLGGVRRRGQVVGGEDGEGGDLAQALLGRFSSPSGGPRSSHFKR